MVVISRVLLGVNAASVIADGACPLDPFKLATARRRGRPHFLLGFGYPLSHALVVFGGWPWSDDLHPQVVQADVTGYAGFLGPQRQFEKQTFAFCVDGCASVVGSLLGTSPVAAFIESAAGIREGGRTGITALVVSFFMFCSLFFAPVLGEPPQPHGHCRSRLQVPATMWFWAQVMAKLGLMNKSCVIRKAFPSQCWPQACPSNHLCQLWTVRLVCLI